MYSLVHMPELTNHAEHKLCMVDAELWPAIRDDIVNNRAQLFQCPNDTYLVLRIEGSELIILACVGSGGIKIMQRVVEIAYANGLSSIRFHTQRPGMPRLLKRFHPVELERVYRINLYEN